MGNAKPSEKRGNKQLLDASWQLCSCIAIFGCGGTGVFSPLSVRNFYTFSFRASSVCCLLLERSFFLGSVSHLFAQGVPQGRRTTIAFKPSGCL
eukprot:1526535-Amphidinium_carterae.2